MTPTQQGREGQEIIMWGVSYPLVPLLKLFICFTQRASIKISLAYQSSKAKQQQCNYRSCSGSLQIHWVSLLLGQKLR